MDLPQRKAYRIEHYDYSQNGSYFVTICTQGRKNILSKISVEQSETAAPATELLTCGKIADKYIRQMDAFYDHLSVDKYMIMPDHIHLMITIHGQQEIVPTMIDNRNSVIAKFVGTFKRFCNKEYGENIWQPRYYDHVIRNQQDYNETWEYIENNPTKWMLMHNK